MIIGINGNKILVYLFLCWGGNLDTPVENTNLPTFWKLWPGVTGSGNFAIQHVYIYRNIHSTFRSLLLVCRKLSFTLRPKTSYAYFLNSCVFAILSQQLACILFIGNIKNALQIYRTCILILSISMQCLNKSHCLPSQRFRVYLWFPVGFVLLSLQCFVNHCLSFLI